MIKVIVIAVLLNLSIVLAGPDRDRNTIQLIESRGFKAETHSVTTSDGYILTLFRMVHPHPSGKAKQAIILQHGLGGNSDQWFINVGGHLDANDKYVEDNGITTDCTAANASSVGNTIGFVLAACGYDVWLGNNRGTKYSTKHTKYDLSKDSGYWSYSVDDLSTDDIAMIGYVKEQTKSDHVGWIGHSMGTTQMFQLLTEKAEYNTIVKPFIAVAPVAYLAHIAPVAEIAANIEKIPFIEDINAPFLFFPENDVKYVDSLLSNVCSLPLADKICESLMFFAMGFNYKDNDEKKMGDFFGHFPDDTSFKVMTQMAHRVTTDTFTKFDFKLTNLVHYGSLSPPKYDLGKITNPNIVFISGHNDQLGDQKDIDKMRKELKVKIDDYVVPDQEFNHMDFIIAKNAGQMVTSKILTVLAKYN